MSNKKILIAAILGVVLIAGYAYLARNHPALIKSPFGNKPTLIESPFKELYVVHRIKVLQGHEFDLKLDNGKRIHARLRGGSVPEAKESVIQFLNENLKNRAVHAKVYDKITQIHAEDIWIIDLIVSTDEGDISLTDWLEEKGLIWD